MLWKLVILYNYLAVIIIFAHPKPPRPPCSDYEMLIINTRACVTRCPILCVNGVCYEDGICPCEGSYVTSFTKGLICAMDCLPGCQSAGGYCASSNLCLCRKKGYYFDAISQRCRRNFRLKDRCFGRCLYGKCTSNGECICAQGYTNSTSSLLFRQLCSPICRQNCGPRGYCHLPDMCACRKKHHHYEADGNCHEYPTFIG